MLERRDRVGLPETRQPLRFDLRFFRSGEHLPV